MSRMYYFVLRAAKWAFWGCILVVVVVQGWVFGVRSGGMMRPAARKYASLTPRTERIVVSLCSLHMMGCQDGQKGGGRGSLGEETRVDFVVVVVVLVV
jgi:hypothetical protein